MELPAKERNTMGAQAVSRDVETMPQSTHVANPSTAQSSSTAHSVIELRIIPARISFGRELIFMLPVLFAVALAAAIGVLPMGGTMLFALLCIEIGLFILSIFVLVPRPQKN
jgi:hypothetical protein